MRVAALLIVGMLACAWPAQAGPPVVVEIYTSQGCGACAEAGQLVENLAEREDLLPLTFSVDYWDYLGWKDTFARPEFSERQRLYAQRWAANAVFTPQVVVAGRGQTRAGEAETLETLIGEAASFTAQPPAIEIVDGRVSVGPGAGAARAAEVWLIRYDPRESNVRVRRGENQGRTLAYRNVVRELVRLGDWTGRAASFDLPEAAEDGLTSLILLQAPGGGEILALHGV